MLIIDVKDGDSLERALKKYKRKFINTGILRELRNRKEYTKPSVRRRNERQKAVYRDKVIRDMQG